MYCMSRHMNRMYSVLKSHLAGEGINIFHAFWWSNANMFSAVILICRISDISGAELINFCCLRSDLILKINALAKL